MKCTKKYRYDSYQRARDAVVRIAAKIRMRNKIYGTANRVPRRAYKCLICDCYHLTSQDREKESKAARLERRAALEKFYRRNPVELLPFEKIPRKKKRRRARIVRYKY